MKDGVIAVFGDVHGALDAMYRLCEQWERRHGEIALVLQTGDMGIFPGDLDKATRRHADQDPTELGAKDYVDGRKVSSHTTYFIRGNHEDHEWLAKYPKGGAIAPSGLLTYVTGRRPVTVEVGSTTVTIAGLGGIAARGRRNTEERNPGGAFDPAEIDALLALDPGSIDILLTHDSPRGHGLSGNPDSGADEVTILIEHLQPRLSFWGHYGHPPDPFEIGPTRCFPMTVENALRIPRRDGAMGILCPSDWSFDYVGGRK